MRTLKDVRLLLGLSQTQLTEKVNISLQQICNIEVGRSRPQQATKEKIERKLFAKGQIAWEVTWERGKLNKFN